MQKSNPFELRGAVDVTPLDPVNRLVESALESSLGLKKLQQLYRQLPETDDCAAFLQATLHTLNVDYRYAQQQLRHIPESGPAVLVCNHPFGGIEGVILADLLLRMRKDIRIVANDALGRIRELSELFIGVNPFETREARYQNRTAVRAAHRWVEQGGLLLVFPAGEVSHLQVKKRAITDPKWRQLAARIVIKTAAPVVPLRFVGNNSLLFQCAGLLHPNFRTALLAREMLNKQRQVLELRIGKPIAYKKLQGLDAQMLTERLRLHTELLANPAQKPASADRCGLSRQPVIAAQALHRLEQEIMTLSAKQKMADAGKLSVYLAAASEIPAVLQEIGRLRELTFRAVGEGTGRSQDLDDYDRYYQHLFIWDHHERCIVGAYRLGPSDEIIASQGIRALYTHSLFRYKRTLLQRIQPAVELGRSFIRSEYQKNLTPLMLLWKGIGSFLAQNPRYRSLFGPVSISNDYATASQQLMIDFLKANRFDHALSRHVKPRRKFIYKGGCPWRDSGFSELADIQQLSSLIASVEQDDKGLPILLKHYLKLGGRLLGFNVDRDFNGVLDGLILVDLTTTDHTVLTRYMGQEAAQAFLDYHNTHTRIALQQVA